MKGSYNLGFFGEVMAPNHQQDNENKIDRLGRLFSHLEDLTLIVLRGHLLIEELLNEILESICDAPKYIENANLSFFQKIQLCRSFQRRNVKGVLIDDDPWESLVVLNTLRNKLAHNLEPSGINERVDDFIFSRFNKKRMVAFKNGKDRIAGLKKEILVIYGYFCGYAASEGTKGSDLEY